MVVSLSRTDIHRVIFQYTVSPYNIQHPATTSQTLRIQLASIKFNYMGTFAVYAPRGEHTTRAPAIDGRVQMNSHPRRRRSAAKISIYRVVEINNSHVYSQDGARVNGASPLAHKAARRRNTSEVGGGRGSVDGPRGPRVPLAKGNGRKRKVRPAMPFIGPKTDNQRRLIILRPIKSTEPAALGGGL